MPYGLQLRSDTAVVSFDSQCAKDIESAKSRAILSASIHEFSFSGILSSREALKLLPACEFFN
jgi:hypothetical protein